MSSQSPNSSKCSLATIQKPKAKRNVLPKTSLIQIFLDNPTTANVTATQDLGAHKCRTVLPKFSSQDVAQQLNLLSSPGSSSPSTVQQTIPNTSNNSGNRCGNMTDWRRKSGEPTSSLKGLSGIGSLSAPLVAGSISIGPSSNIGVGSTASFNYLSHMAKDLLLDCRQRLEFSTFRALLTHLSTFAASAPASTQCETDHSNNELFLQVTYAFIKSDQVLCNKISGFMTAENALFRHNQFQQASQYQKCYEFMGKLETVMPNKLGMRKIVQSIVANSSSIIVAHNETVSDKIADIKAKFKALTSKNHVLLGTELDMLFDQRLLNTSPCYETISMIDQQQQDAQPTTIHAEFIDLTDLNSTAQTTFGTKKCMCNCHQQSLNQMQNLSTSETSSTDSLGAFGHCLLCALRFVKGKLYIKCEGKRAVSLVHAIS